MYELQIDPEFPALCPPLTRDEEEQLEANILADGCREPLVVWAGEPQRRVCPRCQATGHDWLIKDWVLTADHALRDANRLMEQGEQRYPELNSRIFELRERRLRP